MREVMTVNLHLRPLAWFPGEAGGMMTTAAGPLPCLNTQQIRTGGA